MEIQLLVIRTHATIQRKHAINIMRSQHREYFRETDSRLFDANGFIYKCCLQKYCVCMSYVWIVWCGDCGGAQLIAIVVRGFTYGILKSYTKTTHVGSQLGHSDNILSNKSMCEDCVGWSCVAFLYYDPRTRRTTLSAN